MSADTDHGELYDGKIRDDDKPFTYEERRKLREVLREADRADWLRKRIKVLTPWIIAVGGAFVASIDWLSKNFTHK